MSIATKKNKKEFGIYQSHFIPQLKKNPEPLSVYFQIIATLVLSIEKKLLNVFIYLLNVT